MKLLRRLFLDSPSPSLESLELKLPNITSPDAIGKRPPYRNPTPYTISVLTLLCNLGANLDINSRVFFESVSNHTLSLSDLDENYDCLPGILDIQHKSLSSGCKSFGEKKNKSDRGNTFNNGCTMRMLFEDDQRNEGYNIINVKLFNNGTLHFTGVKSIEEGRMCVKIIVERLDRLRKLSKVHEQLIDFYNGDNAVTLTNHRIRDNDIATQCSKDYKNSVDIFSLKKVLLQLTSHLKQKDIFKLSLTCKFFAYIYSSNNSHFWKAIISNKFDYLHISHPTLRNHVIDYNHFNSYVPKINFKQDYFNRCIGNYNYKPIVLFTGTTDETIQMDNESIEMINSNFNTHFFINQRKLTKLLQKNYPLLNSSYEPSDKYHGIKVYWPHPDTVNDNGDTSNIVYIFISIFRTGSIIMSGAKTEGQLNDAYKFINIIIKKYYSQIWIPNE